MQMPFRVAFGILGLLSLASFEVSAQPAPAEQNASATAQSASLSEAQLDQLTAPIALYSDPLVGQILTAATYPLEIVEAQRWLQDPANAALRGNALTAALQQQPWDLSVKSLVPFPQVLQTMDRDLEWTEQLGDAFLAQQGAVMDSIQRLRHRAATAGSLTSTPQQTVSTDGEAIDIEPANPGVVYVPYYDPNVIYGPWPWPDYPPIYFMPAPGIVVESGLWIGFGIGFPVLAPFWGWSSWDWRHHRLGWVGVRGGGRTGPGEHDPTHRRGVPYRSDTVAGRFQAQSEAARRDTRGYPSAAQQERGAGIAGRGAGAERGTGAPRSPGLERGAGAGRSPGFERGATAAPREAPARSAPRAVTPSFRPAPPAFESYGGGAQVRQQSARGSFSRSAPAPAPRAAPSPRGGAPRSH